MSYEKFKPLVMAANIQMALKPFLIFEKDCDYEFEGEIKVGGEVQINGVEKPELFPYMGGPIRDPEEATTFSKRIKLTQGWGFNYKIDDIDKRLSKGNIMQALSQETALEMALKRDKFIAEDIATNKDVSVLAPVTFKTAKDAAKAFSKAKVLLEENDVNLPVTAYVGAALWSVVNDYLVEGRTSNDAIIKNGNIEGYKDLSFKKTNSLYKDESGFQYAILKTKKAYAFAAGIKDLEAYRPEKFFCDAVKGYDVFGGGIVRPKEAIVIPYKVDNAII